MTAAAEDIISGNCFFRRRRFFGGGSEVSSSWESETRTSRVVSGGEDWFSGVDSPETAAVGLSERSCGSIAVGAWGQCQSVGFPAQF